MKHKSNGYVHGPQNTRRENNAFSIGVVSNYSQLQEILSNSKEAVVHATFIYGGQKRFLARHTNKSLELGGFVEKSCRVSKYANIPSSSLVLDQVTVTGYAKLSEGHIYCGKLHVNGVHLAELVRR